MASVEKTSCSDKKDGVGRVTGFTQLGVSQIRVERLQELGITKPTPVQMETIPIVYEGRDVVSQAQTGTGKTLAFVLPMLDRIRLEQPVVQGLILTPTRELALQITAEVKKLIRDTGIQVLAVYGGQDVEAQLHKLKGHNHIVVATPGRLLDHLRRGTISLSDVKMLVLDEADQMLHMGFWMEVDDILRQTSPVKQTMLFSATMPPKIRDVSERLLRNPARVTVKTERVTVKGIRQWAVETTDRLKQDTLVKLLYETQPFLAMIFCRTKRRAHVLNEALQQKGFSSDELHGDLSQSKREQVMKRFREARLQLLVATDVAARGLDVEGVTHVFNYDIPLDVESYIHRIGRTGRAGESGLAITLYAAKDRQALAEIEDGIGMTLERRTEDGSRQAAASRDASRTGRGSRSSTQRSGQHQGDKASNARRDRVGKEKDGSSRRTRSNDRDQRQRTGSEPNKAKQNTARSPQQRPSGERSSSDTRRGGANRSKANRAASERAPRQAANKIRSRSR